MEQFFDSIPNENRIAFTTKYKDLFEEFEKKLSDTFQDSTFVARIMEIMRIFFGSHKEIEAGLVSIRFLWTNYDILT